MTFPTLDTSTEQETVEKGKDDKKSEENSHYQEDSSSLNNEAERQPLQVEKEAALSDKEQNKFSGNGEELQDKRGVKRKRDNDDDNDYNEMNSECLHETQGEKLILLP